MNESANLGHSALPPLQVGDELGFYKVVEMSTTRILLRPDYLTGLLLLVAGILVLMVDVLVFGNAETIVRFMRMFHLYAFYGFRDFLIGLPNAVKGAMFILPIIGFSWFIFMTGRSILVDFSKMTARKMKFFFFGDEVDLKNITSLQLRISQTSTSGDIVSVHLLNAQQQSVMELRDEIAHEGELESTAATDYAKMLSLAGYVAQVLRVPVTRQGEPTKMSAINRTMLDAICPPV